MANFKTSAAGLEEIVAHEGEVLRVYLDPIELPTVGVGHLMSKAELQVWPVGTKITKAESRALLAKDLARFEKAVNSSVKVPLTQDNFDAILSLIFNIGEANFAKSSVLRLLNQKKYKEAADAFLLWNKAGGKVLKGLVSRRKRERAYFLRSLPVTGSTASDSRPNTTELDPVPGGTQEDPNLSTAVPSSNSPDKELADGIGGTIKAVAKTPLPARLAKAVVTAGSLALTFIYSNWEIFLIILLLVAVAAWYLYFVRPKRSGGLDGS